MKCWVAATDFAGESIADDERGQARAVLVLFVVAAFLIEREEAVELQHRTGGAQAGGLTAALRRDVDGGTLEIGALHLAGDGALPDEFIKTRLVLAEMADHILRQAGKVGRTNGFVRFLAFLALVE